MLGLSRRVRSGRTFSEGHLVLFSLTLNIPRQTRSCHLPYTTQHVLRRQDSVHDSNTHLQRCPLRRASRCPASRPFLASQDRLWRFILPCEVLRSTTCWSLCRPWHDASCPLPAAHWASSSRCCWSFPIWNRPLSTWCACCDAEHSCYSESALPFLVPDCTGSYLPLSHRCFAIGRKAFLTGRVAWNSCVPTRSSCLPDHPVCLESACSPSPRRPAPTSSLQTNPHLACNLSNRLIDTTPNSEMEAYPRPRHQYLYTPRLGQRGILTYAGQLANGAPAAGVAAGAAYAYGAGGLAYGGAGVVGATAAAGAAYGVYNSPLYSYPCGASYYAPRFQYSSYGSYGSYYNYGLYGTMYPLANFYSPFQRTYYQTMPTYGQTAYVYPPGPTTTTTTTYHVTNGHAPATAPLPHAAPAPVRPSREDYQTESRRVATQRGAYSARKIMPADARADDPFWCRERSGEWHLRTYYQIENECHPGQWLMDAEIGYLVFHRA
jgi:hypothetical protein